MIHVPLEPATEILVDGGYPLLSLDVVGGRIEYQSSANIVSIEFDIIVHSWESIGYGIVHQTAEETIMRRIV